jgi:hypothetical protein
MRELPARRPRFGWLLAHPNTRRFVQRVFNKSAASRSEVPEN